MRSENERLQENRQSVLEALYELWIDRDPAYDEQVKQLYEKLGEWIENMDMPEADRFTGVIAELCIAYSRRAFLDGARMTGLLLREILLEKETL